MKRRRRKENPVRRQAWAEWVGRAEWGIAIILTLIAIYFHFTFLTHAGALWRDEVNTAEFAGMPSLSSLYSSLQYDGFPLLSTLLVRGWMAAGWGSSDFGLRVFGFLVGLSLLGALWLTCRLLRCAAPLISLALVGLSPWTVRTVDSIRPYGVGIVLIVVTLGLVAKAVETPTPKRFALAGALAILSVQCMYQNAFLLFAICVAGAAVSLRSARPKTAGAVGLIGVAAALSLLLYMPSIAMARSWNAVVQNPSSLGRVWFVLTEALGPDGSVKRWLWVGLAGLAVLLGIFALRSRSSSDAAKTRSSLAFFCGAAVVTTTLVFLVAIKLARLPTEPWYYVPLMAALVPALDGAVGMSATDIARRFGRLVLVIAVAGTAVLPGPRELRERRTNVDLVAAKLAKEAISGDAVVVYPFYYGVTFHRYYRGPASWVTIPPLPDVRIHRYDLLKVAMTQPNAIEPVLEMMAKTLRSGHRVWLVGGLPSPDMSRPAPTLPPAPHSSWGWYSAYYNAAWGLQAAYMLQSHALNADVSTVPARDPVSFYENVPLIAISGWR